jgi:hypothetical protein
MSLSRFYNKTATTKRLQNVVVAVDSGFVETNRKDFVEYLTGIPCLVQPVDAELSSDIEGGFGKDFFMMCDIVDIKDGDRIVIDGEEYRIIGIEKHSFLGHEHMEIIIRIFRS